MSCHVMVRKGFCLSIRSLIMMLQNPHLLFLFRGVGRTGERLWTRAGRPTPGLGMCWRVVVSSLGRGRLLGFLWWGGGFDKKERPQEGKKSCGFRGWFFEKMSCCSPFRSKEYIAPSWWIYLTWSHFSSQTSLLSPYMDISQRNRFQINTGFLFLLMHCDFRFLLESVPLVPGGSVPVVLCCAEGGKRPPTAHHSVRGG